MKYRGYTITYPNRNNGAFFFSPIPILFMSKDEHDLTVVLGLFCFSIDFTFSKE